MPQPAAAGSIDAAVPRTFAPQGSSVPSPTSAAEDPFRDDPGQLPPTPPATEREPSATSAAESAAAESPPETEPGDQPPVDEEDPFEGSF